MLIIFCDTIGGRDAWQRFNIWTLWYKKGFSGGSDSKASACNLGDLGSIPGPRRSPEEGNGNLLQYSCLGNPRDRGAWWAAVYGVAQSQTCMELLSSSSNSLWKQLIFKDGLFTFDGEGNGNPLQYSCLENSMDRGALWATVHGAAKSQTRLSTHTRTHTVQCQQGSDLSRFHGRGQTAPPVQ